MGLASRIEKLLTTSCIALVILLAMVVCSPKIAVTLNEGDAGFTVLRYREASLALQGKQALALQSKHATAGRGTH